MKKAVDIIIQARMGSARLPGKTLLPFGSTTVLGWIVERARESKYGRDVIVATTDTLLDDAIEVYCKENHITCFRGSKSNVLKRYYNAAIKYGSEIIVRISGDSPFTDIKELDSIIELLVKKKLEYVGSHQGTSIVGIGSEVFTFSALEHAYEKATREFEKEHMTSYFYEHMDDFLQKQVPILRKYGKINHDIRLSLDTEDDYIFFTALEKIFQERKEKMTTETVISYLKSHPKICEVNAHVKQKKYK